MGSGTDESGRSRHVHAPSVQSLPTEGGAYLLILEVERTVILNVPAGCRTVLEPGRHVYAGSAHGPGGLRARIGRHVRRTKRAHWHVDRLTAITGVSTVLALPDTRDDARGAHDAKEYRAKEHALVARLLRTPSVRAPAPGFGSSDCRICPAHLLALPDGMDPLAAIDGLAPVIHLLAPTSGDES